MDLFDHAQAKENEAIRLRDRGMSIAADAQESAAPDWAGRAYAAIVGIARGRPTIHVDDVLEVFQEEPHHPNAWGAVWMRAIREGDIERTGTVRPSTDPKKHSHLYPIYRSLRCGPGRQQQ